MQVPIKDIKIGKRLRVEYGDMAGLAKSIEQHGLLHPIVIDSNNNLVAGCRRLLATERLGLKTIEVKILSDLSEKELRILELEENIQRKDLTELERSRNLAEIAETTAAVIKEEETVFTESVKTPTEILPRNHVSVCPDSRQTPNQGGRPSELGVSLRDISERLNIPHQTIYDAQQHVKAVDKYPELADFTKRKAIETARQLDAIPADDTQARGQVLALADQRKLKDPFNEMNSSEYNAYRDKCHKIYLSHHKAIVTAAEINVDPDHLAAWKENTKDVIPSYLRDISIAIAKLVKIQSFLKELVK